MTDIFFISGSGVGKLGFEVGGVINVNDARMISEGDISVVTIGVYDDKSIVIDNLLQSIFGWKHLRKLIPRIMSPVASLSMTMADMLNLILPISNVIITISLVVAMDLSANVMV